MAEGAFVGEVCRKEKDKRMRLPQELPENIKKEGGDEI